MPLRVAGAKHREVIMRMGVDMSEIEKSPELAKRYIQELTATATTGNRKIQQSSKEVVSAQQNMVNTLGRMRLRRSPLTLMTTEFAGLTNSMAGFAGSGNLVRTGILGMSSAFSTFMPVIGIAAIAITGLVAAFLIKSKILAKSSEALSKYKEELKKTAKEQKLLKKDLEDFETGVLKHNKVIFQAIGQILGWGTAAEWAAKKQADWTSLMEKFTGERQKQINLLKIENAILLDKSIPNLERLVKHYQDGYDALVNFVGPLKDEIKYYKEMNEALRNLKSAQESLTKAREEAAKARAEFEKPYIYKAPKMKDVSDYVFKSQVYYELIRRQREYLKAKKEEEKLLRDLTRDYERYQTTVMGYMDQMSGAFINSFRGIEGAWKTMLANMVASFIQSGLTALIMGALFPQVGFAGFFKQITGLSFQQGTPYVPRTGFYHLEQGERVLSREQNITRINQNYDNGVINNYYLLNLDIEKVTRRGIVPIIEKMAQNRQTRILTV